MNVSVELTLSPLQDEFEAPIIAFIKTLRASGLTVLENPLSTQVFGPYDEVMELLNGAIKDAFIDLNQVVLYLKMVKTDRSDYEPHF